MLIFMLKLKLKKNIIKKYRNILLKISNFTESQKIK